MRIVVVVVFVCLFAAAANIFDASVDNTNGQIMPPVTDRWYQTLPQFSMTNDAPLPPFTQAQTLAEMHSLSRSVCVRVCEPGCVCACVCSFIFTCARVCQSPRESS